MVRSERGAMVNFTYYYYAMLFIGTGNKTHPCPLCDYNASKRETTEEKRENILRGQ